MDKPSILICDDEEGIRESLRLILDGHYELIFAADGHEALEALQRSTPTLMLLDMKLPKMDGLDTLRSIRQMAPDLPVLILSAYHSTEVAQEAVRLGATDYIPKPFESKQLLQALETTLKKLGPRKQG